MHRSTAVPSTGLARLRQFLPLLGISKTKLWKDVKSGRFPPPVPGKPYGPAVTVWQWTDIHAFIRGEWKPDGEVQQ